MPQPILEVRGQRRPREYRKTLWIDGVKTSYVFIPRWETKTGDFHTASLVITTDERHPEDVSTKFRHEPAQEYLLGSVAQQVWAALCRIG